jgi:hypothetical protein
MLSATRIEIFRDHRGYGWRACPAGAESPQVHSARFLVRAECLREVIWHWDPSCCLIEDLSDENLLPAAA